MKKGVLVLAGLSVLLFFSCATQSAGIVFDGSVPLEQSALLHCSIGTVISYNGIAVNWEQGSFKIVQIPAGDTLLEWDISTRSGDTNFYGKNILLRYNFKPQKRYFFSVSQEEDGIYGARIFAWGFEEMMDLNKMRTHFVEFVPFLNAKNQRTVLE